MADSPSKKSSDDALFKLKKILLTEDEKAIQKIQKDLLQVKKQINDPESLIQTIHPIIADSLDRKIHESKEEMAEALAPVMGEAIRLQVEEAKEDVADALYPVIGRMISKAVAEAMKKLIENINESISRTLNFSMWLKQIKAKILGISTAEVLIAEQSQLGISDLFFIEKKSGLLIAHAAPDSDGKHMDAQVVGGMLTAIKSFAQDAFKQSEEEQLKEITYSDQSIRIDSSKYSYLAVVFSGVSDSAFDHALKKLHHKMHNRYYRYLRDYRGDNSDFHGIEQLLSHFIKRQSK